jgi:glycosyltransferase involved in cell wall biosynthesis
VIRPKVSVVIPVFNGENFIRDAIDSVLAQTFKDFELIVVDDGSTDSTREITEGFGSRVIYKYQPNAQTGTACPAYNTGISMASGEYLAFLDHDDRWYPHKLESQVAILDRHPEVGLTYSELDDIDQNGNLIKMKGWAQRRGIKTDLLGDFRGILKRRFPTAAPSAMMARRDALERIGGFDSSAPPCGPADVELCVLAGEISKLYFMVRSLGQYRVHPGQMTYQRRDVMYTHYNTLLDTLWNRWKDHPEYRALLLPLYGRFWCKRGRLALKDKDLELAGRYLIVSLKYRPFYVRTWLGLLRLQFQSFLSHN